MNLNWFNRRTRRQAEALQQMSAQVAAINRSQAVIEFALDGTILAANENFLKTLGYALEDVKGRHHSQFVTAGYRDSYEYQQFWAKLARGLQHRACR